MADLALVTANKIEVVESIEQMTLPAAEAIVAGAPVRLDVSTGKLTNANGTVAGEARAYGVAVKTVPAGMPVTAVRRGVLDGYVLDALAYDAAVYLSNTDGKLADAAGTVSVVMGRVIPANSNMVTGSLDKLLLLNVTS